MGPGQRDVRGGVHAPARGAKIHDFPVYFKKMWRTAGQCDILFQTDKRQKRKMPWSRIKRHRVPPGKAQKRIVNRPMAWIGREMETEPRKTRRRRNNMTDYTLLTEQLKEFQEAEPFYVPLFANVSALLWETLPDLNWAGFYFLRDGALLLGPFQGKPACIRIELGRGVCGTAAKEDRVLRVADVHRFPGHIACDCASNAEMVLPIHRNGAVAAVLDLDSPIPARFGAADEHGLVDFVKALERNLVF